MKKTNTLFLAIETATQACSVALQTANHIYQRFEIAPKRHTDLILSMIEDLFQEAGVKKQAIDTMGYGCGPGSFMGVRLATGVAQALGFALNIPLVPISTLQVLAQTAFEQLHRAPILAVWDARMGEVYWGLYDQKGSIMEAIIPDTLSKPEEVINIKTGIRVGNMGGVDIYPKAEKMLPIIEQKFWKNEVISAEQAIPVYLRNEVAHIK